MSVPSTRKYQSDGGPSMKDILLLLKGGDAPGDDPATLLRAGIVFWLIGATDGHAKNFSIFLGSVPLCHSASVMSCALISHRPG